MTDSDTHGLDSNAEMSQYTLLAGNRIRRPPILVTTDVDDGIAHRDAVAGTAKRSANDDSAALSVSTAANQLPGEQSVASPAGMTPVRQRGSG